MKPQDEDPQKQKPQPDDQKQQGGSVDQDVHHDEKRTNDFDPEVAKKLDEGRSK